MKYRLIFLVGLLYGTPTLQAQKKCTETLELTAESILKIFGALQDNSIRGTPGKSKSILYDFGWHSTLCIDGQVKDGFVFNVTNGNIVEFTFQKDGKRKEGEKLYDKLKKQLEASKPVGWVGEEDESNPYSAEMIYYLRDQEENPTREIRLFLDDYMNKEYSVYIRFEYFFPDYKKYQNILDGLKDGSLRGESIGGDEWKSKITLNGQIKSSILSGDYGKNRGLAAADYIFFDGDKGKREEALKVYNELKQKLKMFKPEDWYSDESESADNNTWRYWIQKSDIGFFIDVNLTDNNMVFMEFIYRWEK